MRETSFIHLWATSDHMIYSGYLTPYLGRILALSEQGLLPLAIAKIIYGEGARTPHGGSCHGEAGDISSIAGIIRTIVSRSVPKAQRRTAMLRGRIIRLERIVAESKVKIETTKIELRKAIADEAAAKKAAASKPRLSQRTISRRQQAAALRRSGSHYEEIGDVLGVTSVRARGITFRAAFDETRDWEKATLLVREWSEEGKRRRQKYAKKAPAPAQGRSGGS